MFIKEYITKKQYTRQSKNGNTHQYYRDVRMVVLRCDECDIEFERARSKMDHRRLSNNYFHVCNNCDNKRFAQRKGIERKKIWDMPASSELPVSKY
jgi:hypothetical protein